MSEAVLLRRIMLTLTRAGCRVFRNNVGNGYLGDIVTVLPNGDVVLRNWRRVQFGLAPGSSDVIGWRSLVIKPEHVGYPIAVFTAVEVKGLRGAIRPSQRDFIAAVRSHGGIGTVARSEDDALDRVLREPHERIEGEPL